MPFSVQPLSVCPLTPPLPTVVPEARAGHSATTVDNADIYIFGGYLGGVGFLNDLYKLSTKSEVWLKPRCGGDPPAGRLQHTMEHYDGNLILFGGTGNKMVFNDIARYLGVSCCSGRHIPLSLSLPLFASARL